MLSDLGSWASIISLIIGFVSGFGICKISTKKESSQENKANSLINTGPISQKNNSSQ